MKTFLDRNRLWLLRIVLALALMIVANILYTNINVVCPYSTDVDCVANFLFPNIAKWIVFLVITALLFDVVLLMALYYRSIPIVFSIVVIMNVIFYGYLFRMNVIHGNYSHVFGFYLQFFMIILLMIFFVIQGIKHSLTKKPITTLIVVPTIFLLIGFAIGNIITDSCRDWNKGLGGHTVSYTDSSCKLMKPEICIYDLTSGLFDFTQWFRVECPDVPPHFEVMSRVYPQGNLLGFPRVEHFTREERYSDNMQHSVLNKVIPLKSLNDPEAKDLEVFLDRSNNNDIKFIIDVKRNETLVQERAKITSKGFSKNVLVLFIDTVSRARAYKVLENTMQWFDKFIDQKNSERESFQFFKYHALGGFTQLNMYAAIFGVNKEAPLEDFTEPDPPRYSMVKSFKENGYITAYTYDFCEINSVMLDKDTSKWVREVPFDHEGVGFSCDPNYHDLVDSKYRGSGPFSWGRRCLYGKDVHSYNFEYAEQFWKKYKGEKKLLYMSFIDNHESTQSAARYLDKSMATWLKKMEAEKQLEDTTIILFADHGLHVPFEFARFFQAYEIEKVLPLLVINLPTRLSSKYRVTIKENEQKFASPLQLHKTFLALAEGENSAYVSESMLGKLRNNITCAEIGIVYTPCQCVYE